MSWTATARTTLDSDAALNRVLGVANAPPALAYPAAPDEIVPTASRSPHSRPAPTPDPSTPARLRT
jgi:hypothetical protein